MGSPARTARVRGRERAGRPRGRTPGGRSVRGSPSPLRGWVSEIFASVQGEGIYVGERQVFLRMAGCSATCAWCDTVSSKKRRASCTVYGARKRSLKNPLSVDETVAEVLSVIGENGPVSTVSLTGGEPLEQGIFVGRVARALKRRGCRIYLDTNGLNTEDIGRVIGHVDVVAVDIKLPSATGKSHWDVHRAFLRAIEGVEVFVKLVVEPSTPLEELEEAVRLVAEHDARTPLVLQPEGAALFAAAGGPAGRKRMLALVDRTQRYALGVLEDVRVIPQTHKLLKLR